MEKEVTSGKSLPNNIIPATRYWAGRHHVDIIVGVASALASRYGDRQFTSRQLDPILEEMKLKDVSSEISKGKRWAYLQVQRDIGLVEWQGRDKYVVTEFAKCLIIPGVREQECLSRALIRPYKEKNPVHVTLNLFVEQWQDSIADFIGKGHIVGFRRESDKSIFVMGPKETYINGIGKNEVNQIWNGILPFLEGSKILARFDPREGSLTERVYGPVWDWSLDQDSEEQLIEELKSHVNANYTLGKMISLQDLVYDFWKVRKISPELTKELIYRWATQTKDDIYLVRAPIAVAEEMKYSYIVKATATYGAFVRRRF